MRRHHQILRDIHEASRVWQPLFDSFTQQPAARRATRTPSRSTAQQRQQQEVEENLASEDDEDASFVDREQTFKTTTLKELQPPTSDRRNDSADEDSLNFSLNSDNLPRMSRTPFMSKSAVGSGAKTQESTSTLSSTDRGHWSPRMTSPPRTGVISETANAGPRQISTPPSAISSVEYNRNSPDISRNLMFEYTPPRGKKAKSSGEEKEVDQSDDSIATLHIPEFATVRLSTITEKEPTTGENDDTPGTPDFDLTSPLLRTQLKAMTPNTPLSNRLVGASLDVGSVSQEARLQEYDDSFNAGVPTPKFELSLLPAVFQGADDDKPAISVDQLAEMLPDYGKEKIEILLDTLVSRRLLRPFVVEGSMFWQKPQ
uniref:Outer kinetochore protein ASK1 n=1 Tax=Phytophthora ramorum TaxID=164328 RepID=H3HC11_PHYRM